MIIIKSKGGLGNQIFQYAFGRALSLRSKMCVALDIQSETSLHGIKQDIGRTFLLDRFNYAIDIATCDEIKEARKVFWLHLLKIWRKITHYDYYRFDPRFLSVKDGAYLEGFWWQSEKYFKDIRGTLLRELTLKDGFSVEAEKIALGVRTTLVSVSLHVRRGDYASDEATLVHHGLTPVEYYNNAISFILERNPSPTFFIFSDDIEWVRAHINISSSVFYVSGRGITDPEELVLMSLCKHHIIANSSFSWWGAWLGKNPEKIVIAPKRWISDETVDTSDICPEGWIRI